MERILPAYPLFVKDPNFSFWSASDLIAESEVQSWWGAEKRILGYIRTGGKTYRFLGKGFGEAAAVQTALGVTAFSTDYTFEAGGATVKLRFVSPLPPDDFGLLSMPVCYLDYEIAGADAEIALFFHRGIAYNDLPDNGVKEVRGDVVPRAGYECAFFGRKRQLPLSNHDDFAGADWGYFYAAGERARLLGAEDVGRWIGGGSAEGCGEDYLACFASSPRGVLLFGYDDLVSIDYFGDHRKGYYLEDHTIFEALDHVWAHHVLIDAQLSAFDADLRERAKPYGEEYLRILYASLRQSVASHKLIRDRAGDAVFLSKECGSNGCIATVDVSYPSMPLYLLYAPELVKGMMRPIFAFARTPAWKFPFAPHDAGTYPACCGQVYGFTRKEGTGNLRKTKFFETHFPIYMLPGELGLYDPACQMPVEECANLLVMLLACYRADGDLTFFTQNRDLAAQYADYLVRNGLYPENQLCTDDFAGHLANNLNLAVKATVGVAAYAELVSKSDEEEGKRYRGIALSFAAEIAKTAQGRAHMPLTWEGDGSTYSLKYNLVFDKLLGLGLFPAELFEKETDCYLEKLAPYGTPLDHRASYTKSDWLMWSACLTDDDAKRHKLIAALDRFLRESPDRIPFGDWYDTVTGEHLHFRARTVQGGCFILLLRH